MVSKHLIFVLCLLVFHFCDGLPGKRDKPGQNRGNSRERGPGHGNRHRRQNCGVAAKNRRRGRTDYEDWPWAAIVGKPEDPTFKVICGGTLISERHVLTAAHCFKGITSPATHVRLGEYDLSRTNDVATPQDVAIKTVKIHDGFTSAYLQNDIALIELDGPVEFRRSVRPACLPYPYVGGDMIKLRTEPTIVGWGAAAYLGDPVSVQKEAKIKIVSKESCLSVYDPISKNFISDSQICAGTENVDSCSGDSGGPMLSNEFGPFSVIGITSFGVKCKDPTFPGVYTRVDKFLDWIEMQME